MNVCHETIGSIGCNFDPRVIIVCLNGQSAKEEILDKTKAERRQVTIDITDSNLIVFDDNKTEMKG